MNRTLNRTVSALTAMFFSCTAIPAIAAQATETETSPTHGLVHHEDGTLSYMKDGVLQIGKIGVEKDYLLGDVDGSDSITSLDAAIILTAAAAAGSGIQDTHAYLISNNSAFTSYEEAAMYADVNEDSLINALDAAEILHYAAANGANVHVNPLGFVFYFADENGILQTGIITDAEGRQYYALEDHTLQVGWLELDGKRYYYDTNAELMTGGFAKIENQMYYLNEDGSALCNSWLEFDGQKFYFDASGVKVSGFVTIDDAVYYFTPDGPMQTGWVILNTQTYYLGEDGKMVTGWQTIDGNLYYFHESGAKASGFVTIDDAVYYFTPDGPMQTGWVILNTQTYYLGEDGKMVNGWQTIDGNRYYFEESGTMATNVTLDGYVIGSDGIAISQKVYDLKQQVKTILANNGTAVDNIYNYMRSTNRYKKIESTKTLAQIQSLGWTHFVDYSMSHYYVVCYYMAAKMDFILREAGYECRVVHATHGSGDHYWNQVYINGAWVNYDCTNGYRAYTLNQMIAKGNYKILNYLTPEYH